jgi:hypothetical protein
MRLAVFVLVLCGLGPAPAAAIVPDQVDTFEDGTVANWAEGPNSATAPVNVASGGPAGADDAYLRNTSTGVDGQAGSRLVCFNKTQWKGNYLTAGVTHIRIDVANFGATDLQVRIAFEGVAAVGTTSTKYCSRPAALLPPDSGWQQVTFDVHDLVLIEGTSTVDQVLAKVATLRILSAADPEFRGDQIAGDMGIDNITALTSGTPVRSGTWGRIKTRFR